MASCFTDSNMIDGDEKMLHRRVKFNLRSRSTTGKIKKTIIIKNKIPHTLQHILE